MIDSANLSDVSLSPTASGMIEFLHEWEQSSDMSDNNLISKTLLRRETLKMKTRQICADELLRYKNGKFS